MTDPILEQDAILASMVRRLIVALHPERIYIFGSKARNEAGLDSDYDLMVLVHDDEKERDKRLGKRAYEALRGTGIAADVLVWGLQSFNSRLHIAASLPATIIREGKLLYAR